MKRQVICIIAEGSYPYVVGGVSGWINQMIKGQPDKDFKILSILPSINEEYEIKYELPENLLEVKTIYVSDIYKQPVNNAKFMKYTEEEENYIADIVEMKLTEKIEDGLLLLADKEKSSVFEFTTSEYFWNLICDKYEKEYADKEFNNFYWSYKSVYMFLLNIIQNDILEADIYHAVSTGYAGIIGTMAKIKYNKPLYLTEHGIYAREREEDILKATWLESDFKKIWIDYFYFISKIAYKYSDKIISLFEYNRKLQISLGAAAEKTSIIFNGIDVDRLAKIKKISNENLILGSVLRVVPIKDVKMMIKGFKIILNEIKGAKLYLIGPYEEDKEYFEECQELIKDFNLEGSVIFTGRVDIKEYLGMIDIYLLTSISEGQPLSILEAMAVKIPIIATDVGDCRGILEDHRDVGEAGIIIPPTSYTRLAEEVIRLYNNKNKMELLGENGYKIVDKYYRGTEFLQKYSDLYKEGRG